MKPPNFHYHDPTRLSEALALLADLENAKILAGGHSLMPMLNMRYAMPDHLIDLNRIEGISGIGSDGGVLRIGAMARQRDIEQSQIVRRDCPLMAEAVRMVGHYQTRNRGTLGGSLCHMDPAAELLCVATALDAALVIAGRSGERVLAIADLPLAFLTPNIEPDEILVRVDFPNWPAAHGSAFVEFSRRHGDFAMASCAALLEEDERGTVRRAAIAVGGLDIAPRRLAAAESLLSGRPASEALFAEAARFCADIDAQDDIHASAAYRRSLAATLTERALAMAHARVGRRHGGGA